MSYTSVTTMLVSHLLVFLVTVLAFASGFVLARRPTLLRHVSSKVLAGARRAVTAAREALDGAHKRVSAVIERSSKRLGHVWRHDRERREPIGDVGPHPDAELRALALASPIDDSPHVAGGSAAPAPASVEEVAVVAEAPAPVARRDPPASSTSPLAPLATLGGAPSIRFEPVASRGTDSVELELHSPEWRAAMAAVGERFAAANVCAVVFVHGTFTGTDPLSAYSFVERALPSSIGPQIARSLRQKTHRYLRRVLGDLGNFGTAYVRLYEEAIRPRGARIPCTDFVWSSENHHVGRLEGALGLVRVLATHAELGGLDHQGRPRRILVIGHSHAGQLFALVTQLLARSMATEAIFDIARARDLDVAALETDVATLTGSSSSGTKIAIDFVTFGAPNRYAWATVANVRALHVIAVPPNGSRGLEGDWIRKLGVEGSDFPPLFGEDRRINAALAGSLGHAGFAPARVAAALRAGVGLPPNGEVAFVEYGERGLLATGLGHGTYTRLDGMLFHAHLIAERLYPDPVKATPLGARPAPAPAAAARDLRERDTQRHEQ